MIAGSEREFFAALADARSPQGRSSQGFYRVHASEIWADIDPYMMTREQLDNEIAAGIKLYEKYFPNKSGFGLFEVVLFTVAAASVAIYVAGTAAAAGGAGQAAAQGAAASSATATANASTALAAAGPQGGAWAAAGANVGTGAGASGFAAKAVQVAQEGASYASRIGKIAKATGNSEGDKLIEAANIIEGSGGAKDVAAKLFERELKKRGMELQAEKREALKARMAKENQSYAAWLRRRAEKLKSENPQIETTGQSEIMKWLPIATPILLFALSR